MFACNGAFCKELIQGEHFSKTNLMKGFQCISMKGLLFASVRRFIEMLLLEIALSALAFGLFKGGIIAPTYTGCFFSLMSGAALYWFQNFRWLCRCRLSVPSQSIYLIANYVPYALIMLISFFVLAVCDSETYTWLFAITKFWKYTAALSFTSGTLSTLISAIAFHIFTMLIIWFAPYSISHILNKDKAWESNVYSAGDIIDVLAAPSLDMTAEVKKSVLTNLFEGAEINDINRIVGLPLEEDEEDYHDGAEQ